MIYLSSLKPGPQFFPSYLWHHQVICCVRPGALSRLCHVVLRVEGKHLRFLLGLLLLSERQSVRCLRARVSLQYASFFSRASALPAFLALLCESWPSSSLRTSWPDLRAAEAPGPRAANAYRTSNLSRCSSRHHEQSVPLPALSLLFLETCPTDRLALTSTLARSLTNDFNNRELLRRGGGATSTTPPFFAMPLLACESQAEASQRAAWNFATPFPPCAANCLVLQPSSCSHICRLLR